MSPPVLHEPPRPRSDVPATSRARSDMAALPSTRQLRARQRRRASARALCGLAVVAVVAAAAAVAARRAPRAPRADAAVDAAVAAAAARAAYVPRGATRRVVLLTAVNHAFRDFLANLNCSLRRAGVDAVPLVISMDMAMHEHATRAGYVSLHLPLGAGAGAGGAGGGGEDVHLFGSRGFNLLSKQKLYGVYKVLQTGVDVVFSDADVVLCADAVAEMAHVMYATDWDADGISARMPHLLMQTAWPRSLLNSGLYYARASPELLRAFEAFLRHDGDAENDQVIVNRVLCRRAFGGEMVYNGSYAHPSAPRRAMPALCRWKGAVEARLLDAGRFPTGGEMIEGEKIFHHARGFVVGLCANGDVSALHNNCILTGKKKARSIVKGIWYVGEDGETCLDRPAAATKAMRKICGGAKCGAEGDVNRYPDLVVR